MSDTIKFNTETVLYTQPQPTFKCSGYGLAELIKNIEEPDGIEIGCDVGDTTDFLLSTHPKLKLISIDPYENYVDWNGNSLNEREELCQRMLKRMERFNDRFALIRLTSDEAHRMFKPEQFDFIFIDGLHTYEQLSKDCENYYDKVKTGGIFAGHDYHAIPGVRQAADEFAAKVGREIHFTECDVWYWVK